MGAGGLEEEDDGDEKQGQVPSSSCTSRNQEAPHTLTPPKPTVFISGVIARGDKDFPPAAAQVAHQKPHASMDKHSSPRTQHIQQPRK
ncbi:death-associated protein 1 [Camelus ferus]|nr:death-associated protein 1 [Camelus ferus]